MATRTRKRPTESSSKALKKYKAEHDEIFLAKEAMERVRRSQREADAPRRNYRIYRTKTI
jgi:hypothetical protein